MRAKALMVLALWLALASSPVALGPAVADHPGSALPGRDVLSRADGSPPQLLTSSTSLHDIFRRGRYDTPACFFEHPLAASCPLTRD